MATGNRVNGEIAEQQARDRGEQSPNFAQRPQAGKQTRSAGGAAEATNEATGVEVNGTTSAATNGEGQRAGSWEMTPELAAAMGLSAPTPGSGVGVATLKTDVHVREEASGRGAIVETAKKGATFVVLAAVGSWYEVEHGDGTAYITALPQYVDFQATPAPDAQPPEKTPATQPGGGGGEQGEEDRGNAPDQEQPEQTGPISQPPAGVPDADEPADEPAVPGGSLLFKHPFKVVDPDARLRNVELSPTGKVIAEGTTVFVVKAEKTYVQIVTGPDAETKITEGEQIWTAFSNLGGTGADVGLGNEHSDEGDKEKADTLRASLPTGRGKSPFKWKFGGAFQPSLEGLALEGSLMSKVQALMEWAIENDMVTSDVEVGDGVRGPMTAHRMCVAWNVQYRYEDVITLDALKALAGGKDADGNKWYEDGWTAAEIKANAKAIRASESIAAAGYDRGNAKRAPLPVNSSPGVSRHCTGRAVDVVIPWRAPGKDAADGATDVWAWEDVYKQFGLHRPLHKTLQSNPKTQEHWHIEETDKKLDEAADGEK
jgi:hypothetical protein